MARALLVGCGCRGRELGARLLARGWRVRGTTRDPGHLDVIEDAGIEAALADPARPGTILDEVADVTVVVWALGSAVGEPDSVAALHGSALERLLEKLVETPVRGFVYEREGSLPGELRAAGAGLVAGAARRWRIPAALIEVAPRDHAAWVDDAERAVDGLVGGARRAGG